jgi:hypothetical protein
MGRCPSKTAQAPRPKKGGIAVLGEHFRYHVGQQGQHDFKCISEGHAPKGFPSFKCFVTHMRTHHSLTLPHDYLEPGLPWLSSKAKFDLPEKKAPKASKGKKTEAASWTRLRSTVALRWKMTKNRKKTQLKEDYCVSVSEEEPIVLGKSNIVRVIKVVHSEHPDVKGWRFLLDASLFELLTEQVSLGGQTCSIHKWAASVLSLPCILP